MSVPRLSVLEIVERAERTVMQGYETEGAKDGGNDDAPPLDKGGDEKAESDKDGGGKEDDGGQKEDGAEEEDGAQEEDGGKENEDSDMAELAEKAEKAEVAELAEMAAMAETAEKDGGDDGAMKQYKRTRKGDAKVVPSKREKPIVRSPVMTRAKDKKSDPKEDKDAGQKKEKKDKGGVDEKA